MDIFDWINDLAEKVKNIMNQEKYSEIFLNIQEYITKLEKNKDRPKL